MYMLLEGIHQTYVLQLMHVYIGQNTLRWFKVTVVVLSVAYFATK